jgi:ribosomal protein L7/L12
MIYPSVLAVETMEQKEAEMLFWAIRKRFGLGGGGQGPVMRPQVTVCEINERHRLTIVDEMAIKDEGGIRLILTGIDPDRIVPVVKAVRKADPDLGLMEAKRLVLASQVNHQVVTEFAFFSLMRELVNDLNAAGAHFRVSRPA